MPARTIHAAALTTPEVLFYLSEQLSQNATQGISNEVTDIRLIDAEAFGAWHEANGDHAMIVMRYVSIDLMQSRHGRGGRRLGRRAERDDRASDIVCGSDGAWKLSAIQGR